MDILTVVIYITLVTFLATLFGIHTETVYVDKVVEPSDYQQLKTDNVNLANNLESANSQIVSLNSALEQIKKSRNETTVFPRNFDSREEIRQFLNDTKINELEYIKTKHDCEDFAFELQQAGLRWKDGVFVGLRLVDNKDGTKHMMNIAIAGNNIYAIEPQTDAITKVCTLD